MDAETPQWDDRIAIAYKNGAENVRRHYEAELATLRTSHRALLDAARELLTARDAWESWLNSEHYRTSPDDISAEEDALCARRERAYATLRSLTSTGFTDNG